MRSGIKVVAPATVANVCVGFDAMGFAFEGPHDEVVVRIGQAPGVRIVRVHGAKGLSTDPARNTAGVAAMAVLEAIGDRHTGLELELFKKMPLGSGLGSSAASAVAGAMAANEALRRPLEKRELLACAMQGEQLASKAWHADNVAPCLLGGIQWVRHNASLDVVRLPVPRGLVAAVVYPHVEVLTQTARGILSATVPFSAAVQQAANAGAMVAALYTSNWELLGRSLTDQLVEQQRAHLIPGFRQVQAAAMEAGALGCSISGAGPSVFAWFNSRLQAENGALAMQAAFAAARTEATYWVSEIEQAGARLL